MITMLIYTLKSALVLTLLYLPYTLMLRQESFFKMNRATLLTILVLAMVLPLCDFQPFAIKDQPVVYEVHHRLMQMAQGAEFTTPSSVGKSLSWLALIAPIYIIGVIVCLAVRIWQLYRIGKLIKGGCLWNEKQDEAMVYCHINDVTPFSWMRSIVISESDYFAEGCREILLHEKAHILCHHSFDILLLVIVETLQWWNPIAYMLGSSLRDVHEYEADDHVLQQGISLHNYQTLLVKKALANTSYTFANNFNHSLVKKRLYMMNHPKSNPWLRSKVLYILPMTLVVLTAFATPKLNETVEKVVEKVEKVAVLQQKVKQKVKKEPVQKEMIKALTKDEHTFPASVDMKDVVFVKEGHIISREEFEATLKQRHEVYVANMNGVKTCLEKFGINNAELIQGLAFLSLKRELGIETLGRMIWIQTFDSYDNDKYITNDALLTLNNCTIEDERDMKYVTTNRFELDGIVDSGLHDVSYLIYYYEDNDPNRLPQKPSARIDVENGRFYYGAMLDKPRYARVQAVLDDGTISKAWMNMYFNPGKKIRLTVMDGHFDTVQFPIFEKQVIN